MSKYPCFEMQLEHGDVLIASPGTQSFNGQWLRIAISPAVCGGTIRLLIPGGGYRVERLAKAINAAWAEPQERPRSPAMRGDDVMPAARVLGKLKPGRPPTLMDDDGPEPEAA